MGTGQLHGERVGSAGAGFSVLLAFDAKETPPVAMSIVFSALFLYNLSWWTAAS